MLWKYYVRVLGERTKDVRLKASIIHGLFRNCVIFIYFFILNDEMGYGKYHKLIILRKMFSACLIL